MQFMFVVNKLSLLCSSHIKHSYNFQLILLANLLEAMLLEDKANIFI